VVFNNILLLDKEIEGFDDLFILLPFLDAVLGFKIDF